MFFFVSATLDLLCCSTEFPETIYRINIHYVDVHITRNVRFHKFSGNSYSDFLSFIGCNHYSYDQFVSGPLKLLHKISKTFFSISNAYLSLQTTANIYDHLPIWKKLCGLRSVVWDNDAYHAIHAFSPKLIVCVYSYLKIYWSHL